MKKLIFLTFLIPVILLAEENQTEKPTKGLTVAVQESSFDIQLPLWLNESLIFAPTFGIIYQNKVGTEYNLGFAARIFMNDNKVRPFIGARAGMIFTSFDDDIKSTRDIVIGGGYGVEYFFDDNLSLGIEAQLNLVAPDENSTRFGNPGGVNLNTAAVLFASIYF